MAMKNRQLLVLVLSGVLVISTLGGCSAFGQLAKQTVETGKEYYDQSLCRQGFFLRFCAGWAGFWLTTPGVAIIIRKSKWHSCVVLRPARPAAPNK